MMRNTYVPAFEKIFCQLVQESAIKFYKILADFDEVFSVRTFLKEIELDEIFEILPLTEQNQYFGGREHYLSNAEKVDLFISFVQNEYNLRDNQQLDQVIESYLECWRYNLFLDSVISVSGPRIILNAIFEEYGVKDTFGKVSDPIAVITETEQGEKFQLLSNGIDVWPEIKKFAISETKLSDGIMSQNFNAKLNNLPNSEIGTNGDMSWHEEGLAKQRERDLVLDNAAKNLQKFVLQFNAKSHLKAIQLEKINQLEKEGHELLSRLNAQ